MSGNSPSFVAKGNIAPSRFVQIDSSNDFGVIIGSLNCDTIGISQMGTRNSPNADGSANAAESGDTLQVHGQGETCLLDLGGTVARGERIKSDSTGQGIVVATTGPVQNSGAVALESGVDGDLIRVQVIRDSQPASASN